MERDCSMEGVDIVDPFYVDPEDFDPWEDKLYMTAPNDELKVFMSRYRRMVANGKEPETAYEDAQKPDVEVY